MFLQRITLYLLAPGARLIIVPLEIEHPHSGHPWLKFAGMFKDDPLFDDVLTEIEAYRRELDADDAAI